MYKPKTIEDVVSAMKCGAVVEIGKSFGFVQAIEKEDGTGRNWNITLQPVTNGSPEPTFKVFFREG